MQDTISELYISNAQPTGEIHMTLRHRTSLIALLLSLLFAAGISDAQPAGDTDRLAGVRDIVDDNELIMIWSNGETRTEHYSHQRIYDLDLTKSENDQRLVPGQIRTDSIVTGTRQMAVATGDFFGEGPKHFAAAWPGPDTSMTIIIPHIDSGTLDWTDASRVIVPGPLSSQEGGSGEIHLATGDYSGTDRRDELVMAYHGADNTVHLQLFTFRDESLTPETGGSIADEQLYEHYIDQDNFDIVSGNFNGDDRDEIALLFAKPLDETNWVISAKIYSVNEQGEFIPGPTEEIFSRPINDQRGTVKITGTGGNFDSEPSEEIALAFISATDAFGEDDTYLYILDVQDDLDTIVYNTADRFADSNAGDEITPLNIAAGDLTGNFREEIVLVNSGSTWIFSVDSNRVPIYQMSQNAASPTDPGSHGNEDYFLAVGDMYGSGQSVIVTAAHHRIQAVDGSQYFEVMVVRIDSALNGGEVIAHRERIDETPTDGGYRNFAIALGDFNGDRTWLGDPEHYRRTGLLQPSVILHAPPTHYDILNSTVFDISGCYPDHGCGFTSTYTLTQSATETVSIEVHEDWGVSAGVEIVAPGSKTKLTATYGEKFSNTETQTESITITTSRTATGDDWIFANLYDIDFYEYPVYDGQNPNPVGYYLVSVPRDIRPLWIEAKDDQLLGNQFRPDHEVGNILSYRPYTADGTPDMDSLIVDFPEQTVGVTGQSHVSLERSTFTQNSAATSWSAGGSFEQSLGETGDFYGIEAGFHVNFSGSYSRGEILTQTVSVKENLEIRSDFGHVQPEIGTSGTYYISPFAYWTSSGALVLDYKVDIPEGNSVWRERYGGPDLAFSLPWRYDEEKGIPYPEDDPSYRNRTRDLILSNPAPSGGDTVTIGTRVRNLGLEDIPPPVDVEFYFGDPASDGVQIATAEVDTSIPARSSQYIFVDWIIPAGTGLQNTRIYGILDPENSVTEEIHENNNSGWAPVISLGQTTDITGTAEPPHRFILHQAYPNPFNSATNIQFDLRVRADVTLKVYNMLGQEISALIDDTRQAGQHQVTFQPDQLASGVYLYRITARPIGREENTLRATGKMLFVK